MAILVESECMETGGRLVSSLSRGWMTPWCKISGGVTGANKAVVFEWRQ